jgi:hypothetical protein
MCGKDELLYASPKGEAFVLNVIVHKKDAEQNCHMFIVNIIS